MMLILILKKNKIKQYNKNELCNLFVKTLDDFEISWNSDYPEFYKNSDLLKFLSEQKSNEELNYKEKSEMIQKAKKILNYCRNGFMLSFTEYLSHDAIYQDGIIVANHCDIPTCRRAIDELNTDPKILITKSDGSYLYLTTDLATVINRKSQNFDTVLYVVDKRQSLHFNQLFQCVEYFGIDNADFQHIAFGTVNDSLGNPFKTREGGTKKLIDLFEETKYYVKDINKNLDDSTINKLANTILTFSDLITNRKTDYKFDLEKFSNISGKTGIYVQYALVRAKKLLNKSKLKLEKDFYITKLDEKDLNLIYSFMKFEIYFEQALNNSEPHHLADYLYELSNLYNSMYQSDNILDNSDLEIMSNKLLITSYFVDYSKLLMESLGIFPVDEM